MNPFSGMTGEQIRDTWQSRALAKGRDTILEVLMVVFYLEYAAAFPLLYHATFGRTADITFPTLSGYAGVMPSGRLVCDKMFGPGDIRKVAVYDSESAFILDMRKLADRLKLSDQDRIEFFRVLQRWVASDLRPARQAGLAS